MSEDVRGLLGRGVGWFQPPPDPDRVILRARRRVRSRKVLTVTVAFLLFAGSGSFAVGNVPR